MFGDGWDAVELLISIYCTRKKDFDTQTFKAELRRQDIEFIKCHKVYMLMQIGEDLLVIQVWRKK